MTTLVGTASLRLRAARSWPAGAPWLAASCTRDLWTWAGDAEVEWSGSLVAGRCPTMLASDPWRQGKGGSRPEDARLGDKVSVTVRRVGCSRGRAGAVGPPAAEVGDLARVNHGVGFAKEALYCAAVRHGHSPDCEGRPDRGDEAPEGGGRQPPDLRLDRAALLGVADHEQTWPSRFRERAQRRRRRCPGSRRPRRAFCSSCCSERRPDRGQEQGSAPGCRPAAPAGGWRHARFIRVALAFTPDFRWRSRSGRRRACGRG
jgi:hypothetical protein